MAQNNEKGTQLAKVLFYYGLINSLDDEQKIICPFHDDINPSMKIDLQEGSWFCFGCNKSGDALKFVCNVEFKINKLNDLKSTLKFYKILKSKDTDKINIGLRTKKVKCSEQSLIEAKDFYFNLKKQNWNIRPEDEDAKKAILYMKKRGFTFNVLTKCGCKYTYSKNYPLVFPMYDNQEFKGWVCRTTTKSVEKKRKYLYNEGFSRRNTLCGSYSDSDGLLYIVEGYMDRLKLNMFGVKNAVAILGWKITNEQLLKLKRAGFKTVISALDNDICGKKGTKYLKGFFKVIQFSFDEGVKDIGDMTLSTFVQMNKRTLKQIKGDNTNEFIKQNKRRCQESRVKQR